LSGFEIFASETSIAHDIFPAAPILKLNGLILKSKSKDGRVKYRPILLSVLTHFAT